MSISVQNFAMEPIAPTTKATKISKSFLKHNHLKVIFTKFFCYSYKSEVVRHINFNEPQEHCAQIKVHNPFNVRV